MSDIPMDIVNTEPHKICSDSEESSEDDSVDGNNDYQDVFQINNITM